MGAKVNNGRPEVRSFLDKEGRRWRVFELERPRAPDASMTHLVFDSDVVIRCVSSYPADWHDLPDAELEELSWSA